jgi:hypothetical protein
LAFRPAQRHAHAPAGATRFAGKHPCRRNGGHTCPATADGKWSASEHLAHLGRYHEVFLGRLERILAEATPQLGRYRSEDDPGAEAWFAMPAVEVVERMSKLRGQLIERVAKLGPDDLRRSGVHPAFGEMPLTLWIEFFLVHEGHHLYAILKLAGGTNPS